MMLGSITIKIYCLFRWHWTDSSELPIELFAFLMNRSWSAPRLIGDLIATSSNWLLEYSFDVFCNEAELVAFICRNSCTKQIAFDPFHLISKCCTRFSIYFFGEHLQISKDEKWIVLFCGSRVCKWPMMHNARWFRVFFSINTWPRVAILGGNINHITWVYDRTSKAADNWPIKKYLRDARAADVRKNNYKQ